MVSIRTHLPDAHVTRWPSGRARSRPPTAPLITLSGRTEHRKGWVSLPFANALRNRPRIFTGTCAIVSRMYPSRSGVHPTTTARTRGTLDLVRVAEKIALSQLGSDFPSDPLPCPTRSRADRLRAQFLSQETRRQRQPIKYSRTNYTHRWLRFGTQ